jgi:hypothetical protein
LPRSRRHRHRSVDNSRAHSAIEAWAGNLKNGLDEGLAYVAQWLNIADIVTANDSTGFAALMDK